MEALNAEEAAHAWKVGCYVMSIVALLVTIVSGTTLYWVTRLDRKVHRLESTPGVRTLLDLRRIGNGNGKH